MSSTDTSPAAASETIQTTPKLKFRVLRQCLQEIDPHDRDELNSLLAELKETKLYEKLQKEEKEAPIETGEPLLDPKSQRFTVFPIGDQDIWRMYKIQLASFWKAEEINFTGLKEDMETLNSDEQHFIKWVLAFFAASDGIVNFNIGERFSREVKNMEAMICYDFQKMMENIHCVAGDTDILTDLGYFPIKRLTGTFVNVWNGRQFSRTLVKPTGEGELFRVTLSDGQRLDCTGGHRWFTAVDEKSTGMIYRRETLTQNLEPGALIADYDLPVLDPADPNHFENPRGHGRFCLDDTTDPVTNRTRFFVPLTYSLATKIEWVNGLFEAMITRSDGRKVMLTNMTRMIREIQLLLGTMGIRSRVSPYGGEVIQLEVGSTEHIVGLDYSGPPIVGHLRVVSIEPLPGIRPTYCFNEPEEGAGVFNGILTGNSEVYSLMLDNIIADPDEKKYLFNAIETIPVVKKMADWAFKWIDSDLSFAHRIVAFAAVEGVFFSGAFAAIFWFKKYKNRGRLFLEGLVKSNEFIARDEGLHTDFACLLYRKLQKKLPNETVYQIMGEAVEIAAEFTNDALRVDLIGMKKEMMVEYLKYIADRLLVSLQHPKLYDAKNPFSFMNTIGLLGKANFFENRETGYQDAHVMNKSKDKSFKRLPRF